MYRIRFAVDMTTSLFYSMVPLVATYIPVNLLEGATFNRGHHICIHGLLTDLTSEIETTFQL